MPFVNGKYQRPKPAPPEIVFNPTSEQRSRINTANGISNEAFGINGTAAGKVVHVPQPNGQMSSYTGDYESSRQLKRAASEGYRRPFNPQGTSPNKSARAEPIPQTTNPIESPSPRAMRSSAAGGVVTGAASAAAEAAIPIARDFLLDHTKKGTPLYDAAKPLRDLLEPLRQPIPGLPTPNGLNPHDQGDTSRPYAEPPTNPVPVDFNPLHPGFLDPNNPSSPINPDNWHNPFDPNPDDPNKANSPGNQAPINKNIPPWLEPGKRPAPPEYPFSGGQSAVQYHVEVTVQGSDVGVFCSVPGETFNAGADVWGPILSVRPTGTSTVNCRDYSGEVVSTRKAFSRIEILCHGNIYEGARQSQPVSYTVVSSSIKDLKNTSVTRRDGVAEDPNGNPSQQPQQQPIAPPSPEGDPQFWYNPDNFKAPENNPSPFPDLPFAEPNILSRPNPFDSIPLSDLPDIFPLNQGGSDPSPSSANPSDLRKPRNDTPSIPQRQKQPDEKRIPTPEYKEPNTQSSEPQPFPQLDFKPLPFSDPPFTPFDDGNNTPSNSSDNTPNNDGNTQSDFPSNPQSRPSIDINDKPKQTPSITPEAKQNAEPNPQIQPKTQPTPQGCTDLCLNELKNSLGNGNKAENIQIEIQVFDGCDVEKQQPKYTTQMLSVPANLADAIKRQINDLADLQGKQCLPTEAIAAIPEWWAVRVGADRPQLVILFAEELKTGKLTTARWSTSIPHYNGVKMKPKIPAYNKGNFRGELVLMDNSKLSFNCASVTECKRVLNKLKILVPIQFRKDKQGKTIKPKITQEPEGTFKECRVIPISASYFKTGQKNAVPDWTFSLRK